LPINRKPIVSLTPAISQHHPAVVQILPHPIGKTSLTDHIKGRTIIMLTKLLARFGFGRKEIVDERFEARMTTLGRRHAALPGQSQQALFKFQL
jgi:hypothetical protein